MPLIVPIITVITMIVLYNNVKVFRVFFGSDKVFYNDRMVEIIEVEILECYTSEEEINKIKKENNGKNETKKRD